ncbi:MAG: TolC family outer membrane protein [Asticcacaulis sp.]|nr:TolC family outer membrane protein [Asticcacaulis sp.]
MTKALSRIALAAGIGIAAMSFATDEGYVQTRSNFGPSLSLGVSQSYADRGQNFAGDRSFQSVSVSANQTLFTSGGLSASLEASKAGVKSGQESLRATESSLLLNVISVYTAVRRDQDALRISQDNYDILKSQLDQTQAQFEAGQLTRTDVAQSQARLSASAAGLASAQAQLDSDRASYVAIVGQAPTALDPVPDLPGLPGDFNNALSTAEKNNPDLAAAQYADDAAAARVKAERSVFGPTVGLSVSSGKSGVAGQLGNSLADTSATVRVSVPLFSSGLNGSRVREALENETASRLAVEQTRRSVVSTVSQAWSNMIAARSAVTSNQEQVKAAQIAAEGVKTEQQVGLRTNIEVLNAEQELKSAQLDLVNAQRSQYVAAAQLMSVTGGLTAQAFVPNLETYDPQKHFDKVQSKGWTPIVPVVHAVDKAAEGLLGSGRK